MSKSHNRSLAYALGLLVVLFGTTEHTLAKSGEITADERIAACKRHPRCTTYSDVNGTLIFTGSGHQWDCPKGKKYCILAE